VDEVIRPALAAGQIVLCDRFTDSTLAYQGHGRGLDPDVILALDRIACRGLKPDITVLIDIDPETSLARARRRNERMGQGESRIDDEHAEFHARVRRGYLALARQEPARFVVIDGRAPIDQIAHRIAEALESHV
jgi:dTMP kinase